jgi:aryl-alcohol dehydrogenase-like predicted oxidoreductase
MKLREFGKTALRVSELGLGCARIGGVFQSDSKAFINLLSGACDAGINFFDTADMYSQGESEKLIGRALRSRRDQIIIASKAGYALPAQRRLAAMLKPILRPAVQLLKIRRDRLPSMSRGTITQDFSAAYLQRAVEGSLRRLRTDYLDLFQLHSPSLEVIERSVGRADLFQASEVFLTGSGAGIVAVRSLDGRTLGTGKRGPVTAQLAELHRALAESEGTALL